jgi:hypothetical protein
MLKHIKANKKARGQKERKLQRREIQQAILNNWGTRSSDEQ